MLKNIQHSELQLTHTHTHYNLKTTQKNGWNFNIHTLNIVLGFQFGYKKAAWVGAREQQ